MSDEPRSMVEGRIAWLHDHRADVPPPDHELITDAEAVGEPRLVLHALMAVAGACCFAEDWDGVERYGTRALAMLEATPGLGDGLSNPSLADLHNRLARLGDTACDLPQYLAHTTMSLIEAADEAPLVTTAIFTHNIADACFELGHVGAGTRVLAASRVRAIHDPAHKALAGHLLARMTAYEGDAETAVAYTREAAGLAAQNPTLARQMLRSAAELCLRSGYVDDAKRMLGGLEVPTSGDTETETEARYEVLRGQIALSEGRTDQAEASLRRIDTILDPDRHIRGFHEGQMLRAGVALAGSSADDAVERVAAAARTAREQGVPVHMVAVLDDLELAARKAAGDMAGAAGVLDRIIARDESRLDPVERGPDQARRLADVLDRLQARVLEDLVVEKAELGSMVAHDLRGLLQVAGLILELTEQGDVGEFAEKLRQSCRSALRLVETLSLLNSLERGMVHLNQGQVAITDLLDDIARLGQQLVASKHQRLEVDNRVPDDVGLLVDPYLFSVVAMNLVSNACKFSPPGTTVTIVGRIRHDRFEFEVLDEGPGIPAAEAVWIFQRGAQGQARSDDHGPSLGLGLYIADRLAALLGARIGASQREGGPGARLHLRFPALLTDPAAVAGRPIGRKVTSGVVAGLTGGGNQPQGDPA